MADVVNIDSFRKAASRKSSDEPVFFDVLPREMAEKLSQETGGMITFKEIDPEVLGGNDELKIFAFAGLRAVGWVALYTPENQLHNASIMAASSAGRQMREILEQVTREPDGPKP